MCVNCFAVCVCVFQLPFGLLLERDKRAKWNGIPTLLQKLYESSHLNSDLSHAHSFLKVAPGGPEHPPGGPERLPERPRACCL